MVVALTRAAGNALDASSILARTVAVLGPEVALERASLWRTASSGLELVATHPTVTRELEPLDLVDEERLPGALSLALHGRNHVLGRLVVHSMGGSFSRADEALLEIAATQIAGALERSQLFTEVMELERLKTDFIARVSHELRTPITIINGFLETLLAHDDHLDGEQRRQMLERSRTASNRLAALIEELLILSRIEAGVLTPHVRQLSVAALFDDVRRAAAEPEQVLVATHIDEPIPSDGALLGRALGLLVDNAVKYGGVAELAAHVDGDRWVVEVRDRGPGFADDVAPVAFEMFTRSQSSSSVPGLGVGLAIARTLIEILDGTIEIDDAHEGPGALVRVSLPA